MTLRRCVYSFGALFMLSTRSSCPETKINAQALEDTNKMKVVRESSEDTMETAMERSSSIDSAMSKDSIA